MRILLDTNILINREQNQILSLNLQELLRSLNLLDVKMFVHPESVKEIANDPDEIRRNINLSKVGTYPVLEQPPNPSEDSTFLAIVKQRPNRKRDKIDNALLYAIYKDAAHFLVTEDKGIHKKADKLFVKDRVLSIEEGVTLFAKSARTEGVDGTPVLQYVPAYTLNLDDPFFDSLKEEYKAFPQWWKKISREGRKCWVYLDDDGAIGAFLMYKLEDEAVELASTQALAREKREGTRFDCTGSAVLKP
jgi:predicted nucleic acid-binding protein